MATKAQTKANRNNSQKSTGPRSAEGKAAVSKNAVKHGLFSGQDVINGESQEDYDLKRQQLIDELNPVGKMEFILAERIVSLSWRLKRVERFQNIVIDAMIDKQINSPTAKMVQRMLPRHLRRPPEEENNPDLILGNIIVSDYFNAKVLDRLSIYERRIENSLFKTMAELKRLQLMRELEEERREKREERKGAMDERYPGQELKGLKGEKVRTAANFAEASEGQELKGLKGEKVRTAASLAAREKPGFVTENYAEVKYAKQSQFERQNTEYSRQNTVEGREKGEEGRENISKF